ncbi:hypothetical protein TcWFU_002193 [Taenia crassiceps]|uniref:Uncharacterized protein n=1 Tax=Taenia crassiceps TaxID=6207 RepID=A0ABR4QB08_9CEST
MEQTVGIANDARSAREPMSALRSTVGRTNERIKGAPLAVPKWSVRLLQQTPSQEDQCSTHQSQTASKMGRLLNLPFTIIKEL